MALGNEILGTSSTGYIWPIVHDFIIPGIQDQFYAETFLLDLIKSSSKDVNGRQILIKHRMKRNRGSGTFYERGPLPQAKTRVFKETSADLKFFAIPVDFSGPEMRLTKGKDAKLDLIADGFEDAMKAGLEEMNFQLWKDGTGRRCQVNGAITSDGTNSTVTFDGGSQFHLFPGMSVTFGTGDVEYEILSVPTSTTFVIEGTACYDAYVAGTIANDQYVYRNGAYISDYSLDIWGLGIHCNTTNHAGTSLYQGIDRTAAGNEAFQAYMHSIGTYISSIELIQHIRTFKQKCGQYPDVILTDPGTLGAFILLLESKGSGTDYVVSKTGFARDLKFVYAGQEMILRVADDCPAGYMYMFRKDALEIREGFKLQWDMYGGGKLKVDKDTDTYWGRMLWYLNMICLKNLALSAAYGITADAIAS